MKQKSLDILMVDLDEPLAHTLGEALNLTIDRVSGPAEALGKLSIRSYSLVIIEPYWFPLPESSPAEGPSIAAVAEQAHSKGMPVMVFSAVSEKDVASPPYSLSPGNYDAYLTKPERARTILETAMRLATANRLAA